MTSDSASPHRANSLPRVPDHELLSRIGSGSYGEVRLARNSLGTLRAVKIVRRAEFDDERPYEREFAGIRKFEPISRSHEGFVDLLQVGRNDAEGYFYYVMELADAASAPSNQFSVNSNQSSALNAGIETNGSLNDTLITGYSPRTLAAEVKARGSLPLDECLRIAHTLTSALAELHRQGLVHRDIKPSNIIFVDGVPKLADIGLVAAANEARSFVGTEGFIAPEGPGTPQADLYSLGIVLYVISTGKSHRDFPEPPADLASRPDRERWLELQAIIHRACQADPRERYETAESMHTDLELLKRGDSVRRKHAFARRWNRMKKIALSAIVLALVVAGVFWMRQPTDADVRSAIPDVNVLVENGNLCILSETAERAEQALTYFRQAIDLDPQFVPAWFGLFQAQMRQAMSGADWKENLRVTARKLMEIDPSLVESRFASALVKWIDWQFRDAVAEARSAITTRAASKKSLGWAHFLLGWFLLETGEPEAALTEYELAERLLPATPVVLSHLGHPYFVQRRFKEALNYYQQAVALEPRYLLSQRMIGQVYEATGDLMKAIDAYERGDKESAQNYYEQLREAVQKGGAEGYYRKKLELALAAPEPNSYWIARNYAAWGKMEDAYKWLERALAERNDALADDLMVSLCWDHNDERFKAVARKVGLMH